MKSICFFCSYYTGNTLPFYVKFYLQEVKRHFSDVVLVTNERELAAEDNFFLKEHTITLMMVENEGYDFGMWYKAFQQYDVSQYERVGLINDSCILFKKLDFFFTWLDTQNIDYCGLTDCYLIGYHIQSYFIVINKKAIPLVTEYFSRHGILKSLKEVIKTYEVNLSNYLLLKGMNVQAYFSLKNENPIYNPSWMKIKNLIKKGFPMIKKKIIIREYGDADWKGLVLLGFDPFPSHYIKLIRKAINNAEYLDDIFIDLIPHNGLWSNIKFNIDYILVRPNALRRKAIREFKNIFRPTYKWIMKALQVQQKQV